MFKLFDFSTMFDRGVGNGTLGILLLFVLAITIAGFFKFCSWSTKEGDL